MEIVSYHCFVFVLSVVLFQLIAALSLLIGTVCYHYSLIYVLIIVLSVLISVLYVRIDLLSVLIVVLSELISFLSVLIVIFWPLLALAEGSEDLVELEGRQGCCYPLVGQ